MKQKSIILTVILFSCFVLFVALLTERYFKLSTIEIRKEAIKKETFRKQNIDRNLIKIALDDGYFPIVYPVGYRADIFLKFVDDLPPLGGKPHTDHYYSNEGYGLIKYKSDRFGFRNDDKIWDNINILKNKVLLVGGSSAHGCCVEKEDSLAANINGNVFNVAFGGNDPHISNSNVNVFTNYVKPDNLVVVIFGNNFGSNKKEDLFDNIVSEKGYICGNQPCEKIVQTSINAHKLLISVQKDFGKKKSFLSRAIEYLKITHLAKRIKHIKRSYFSNDLTIVLQKLALNSKKKCESANCNLFFVYIPNSEIYRPNILSELNKESLFNFLKVHKIQYIDMNKYFEDFNRDDLYAVQGPHLSPKGYKFVADKINQYIQIVN